MQARHQYLLNIFEKLGAPLLTAVAEGTLRDQLSGGGENGLQGPAQEAEKMASLLGAAAEMGISLSRQMDLRMASDSEADGIRLTLAALSAPLIANAHRLSGRPPAGPDLERLAATMQAVTLFADNFSASADANIRMQALEQDFALADGPQIQLNILQALVPVVGAVGAFSFGAPESALVQEILTRLLARVETLRQRMLPDLSERDAARAEIALLRTAAILYSQAHFAEMSRLLALEEDQRDQMDLTQEREALWRQVDSRLDILALLAGMVVEGTGTGETSAPVRPVAPPRPAVQPQTPPPSQPQTPPASGNPMAFFSTPKTPPQQGETE